MLTYLSRRRAVAAGLALSALIVAGCGSDDDSTSSDGGATTTTASSQTTTAPGNGADETTASTDSDASPAEMVDVRVGNFGHNGPTTLILQHAAEAGIFERNGINYIEEAPIYNAAQITQSVEQGQADLGIIGPSGAVPLIDLGRPLQLVGNMNIGMALHLVLTNDAYAAIESSGVTVDSPLEEKVQALRDLTIAAPAAGSAVDTTLRYVLDRYGVNPDSDLLIQPFGDNASLIAAGREGSVDVVATIAGSGGTALVADGLGVEFINFGIEDPVVSTIPVYAVVASESFVEDHQDAVVGFLQSLQEAREDIAAGLDQETIDELKEKYVPDMDVELYEIALETALPSMTSGDIVPLPEQGQAIIDVYNATAETPVSIGFDDLYRVDLAETALERVGTASS